MADLIEEPCPTCKRKSVEVEFKYRRPWMLGVVWAIVLLIVVLIAAGIVPLIPASLEWRLAGGAMMAGILSNILRAILEPRLAQRTAYLRCRLCGETKSVAAIEYPAKS